MQFLAHIQMPEGGTLRCLMECSGEPVARLAQHSSAATLGTDYLCELDYGQDVGQLVKTEEAPPNEALPSFRVIRTLTAEDEAQLQSNAELAQKARQSFTLSVRYEKTPVKVLSVRFSFARERLFIRYSAAVAVDLRRFINQLQRDFKTVVDLWQVGARDEAARVGCVGICGRAACCCAWQRQFPNPGTRMAKAQSVPLNPVNANGRCGRLKCCLAFEYDQYSDAGQGVPEQGSMVRCLLEKQDETGIVVDRNVMGGKVTVRTRDGRTLKLVKEDVILVRPARPDDLTKGDGNEDSVGEWSEP